MKDLSLLPETVIRLVAVAVIIGNLSNGRFRGDGDLDRKLNHDPCITAHDLANFPAVAGTSAT